MLMTLVGSVSSIIRFPEFEVLRFGVVLRLGVGRTEISSEVEGVGGEILQVSLCADISVNGFESTILHSVYKRLNTVDRYSRNPDNGT